MKDILNGDLNGVEDKQFSTLEDMGIGFEANSLAVGLGQEVELGESIQASQIEEIKNVEETSDNLVSDFDVQYSNIDSQIEKNPDINEDSNEDSNIDISKQVDIHDNSDVSIHDNIDVDSEKKEVIDNSTSETDVDDVKKDNTDIAQAESAGKFVIDGEVESTMAEQHGFKDVSMESEMYTDDNISEDDIVLLDDPDFMGEDIAPIISKYSEEEKKIDKDKSKKENKIKQKRTKSKKVKEFDPNRKKRMVKVSIIAASIALVLSGVFLLANRVIANNINFTDFSDTVEQEEKFDTESILDENAEVVEASEFNWDMIKGDPTYDENIYNILIVGGDIAGVKDARGNSDTLIIVSIDKNTKQIKLTSIMRDTYVPIPGHSDNKINSAYATGGVPLIEQVIEENFKVTIDSCVVVNYSTFVKAIQKLGGVKGVVLNSREASFINSECAKKGVSSNLVEGTHDLNAYQALNFVRIRKISSDIYGSDDFGRTARQRFVINQLFKQYKNLSYTQLAGLLTSVMSELEIDEALKKDIFLLAQVAIKFNAQSLQEFRLPMDDAYSFASVPVPGSYMNMSVVKIDNYWQTNVDGLHQFIYGTTIY